MPLLKLPHGQTVTLRHRTVTGQDARHNDVYSHTDEVIDNCAIAQGGGTEVVAGTEMVSSDVTVWFPDGTNVLATDTMLLPDGNWYEVQGSPNFDQSPWTGITSFVETRGRLVTGSTV